MVPVSWAGMTEFGWADCDIVQHEGACSARQPADLTNMTYNTDPYITHMDLKGSLIPEQIPALNFVGIINNVVVISIYHRILTLMWNHCVQTKVPKHHI